MRLAASLARLTSLGGKKASLNSPSTSAATSTATSNGSPASSLPPAPQTPSPVQPAERVVEDGLAASGWCALVMESGPLELLAGSKDSVVVLLAQQSSGAGSTAGTPSGRGGLSSQPPVTALSVQQQLLLSLAQMQGSVRCCMSSLSKASTALESLPSQSSGSCPSGAAAQISSKGLYQLKPIIKSCRIAEEGMATACSKLHASLHSSGGSGSGSSASKRHQGGEAAGSGRGGSKATSGHRSSQVSSSCDEDLFQVWIMR